MGENQKIRKSDKMNDAKIIRVLICITEHVNENEIENVNKFCAGITRFPDR